MDSDYYLNCVELVKCYCDDFCNDSLPLRTDLDSPPGRRNSVGHKPAVGCQGIMIFWTRVETSEIIADFQKIYLELKSNQFCTNDSSKNKIENRLSQSKSVRLMSIIF